MIIVGQRLLLSVRQPLELISLVPELVRLSRLYHRRMDNQHRQRLLFMIWQPQEVTTMILLLVVRLPLRCYFRATR